MLQACNGRTQWQCTIETGGWIWLPLASTISIATRGTRGQAPLFGPRLVAKLTQKWEKLFGGEGRRAKGWWRLVVPYKFSCRLQNFSIPQDLSSILPNFCSWGRAQDPARESTTLPSQLVRSSEVHICRGAHRRGKGHHPNQEPWLWFWLYCNVKDEQNSKIFTAVLVFVTWFE